MTDLLCAILFAFITNRHFFMRWAIINHIIVWC